MAQVRQSSLFEGPIIERILVVLLVAAYFLRMSSLHVGLGRTELFYLCYGTLILMVVYTIFAGRWRLNMAGVLLVLLTVPSVLLVAFDLDSSLRWFGWVAALAAVGPLFRSDASMRIKRSLLKLHSVVILSVACISFGMLLTNISLGGRGGFSGLMAHALVIGIVGALASVNAFCRAGFSQRPILWLGVAAISGLIPVISGARGALLALFCGGAVVAYQRGQTRWIWWGALVLLVLIWTSLVFEQRPTAFGTPSFGDHSSQVDSWLDRLRGKGFRHTRQQLWEQRLQEFAESPIFGMGFHQMGLQSDEARDTSRTIEPGSSYLAVLAMTGLSGVFGMLLMGIEIIRKTRSNWCYIDPAVRQLLSGWITVLAVNMIFEGYIMAVGFWFCILFWLLIGLLADLPNSVRGLK